MALHIGLMGAEKRKGGMGRAQHNTKRKREKTRNGSEWERWRWAFTAGLK